MTRKWRIILTISLLAHVMTIYVVIKALEYRSHINEFLYKYENVVGEFSERAVYAKENMNLSAPQAGKNRIVLFGTQMVTFFPASIDIPGWEIVNRGVTGQRAGGLLLRFQSDVANLQPQAVLIEFNQYNFRPNNSVKELEEYYLSLVRLANGNNIMPILTTIIPPRQDYHVYEHENYKVVDSAAIFSDWVRSLATREAYPLADFARVVSDTDGYMQVERSKGPAGLDSTGYDLLAGEIQKALRGIEKNL